VKLTGGKPVEEMLADRTFGGDHLRLGMSSSKK